MVAQSGRLTQWEHMASTYRALIGLDLEEPDPFETWIGQARALFANDEFRGVVFLHRYIALGRGAFDRAAADMERAAPSSGCSRISRISSRSLRH